MLPYWCLLDIFKSLSRNDLERIQVTNRMLNNIVIQNFTAYPLRIMAEAGTYVQVRNNELVLSIEKNDCYFAPATRQWNFFYCNPDGQHFYPINTMLPLLCKTVRFRFTIITIHDSNIYTSDHIATLESIAHVWDAKQLHIYDRSENDPSSLSRMLESSSILRCRTLYIRDKRKRIRLLQHPNVYALRAVDLSINRSLSGGEILQLFEQKASYPESDTIFVLESAKRSIELAMEIIRQMFLTSDDRCRLRCVITMPSLQHIPEFCLKNTQTCEVLELKHISEEEANALKLKKFSKPALLLDRSSI
ncbi:hypothetical protein Ddc_18399 [Ditylenchus destructor]|nr:hypothetical protein Ddc_18399 [Ditylenchus destructor]